MSSLSFKISFSDGFSTDNLRAFGLGLGLGGITWKTLVISSVVDSFCRTICGYMTGSDGS